MFRPRRRSAHSIRQSPAKKVHALLSRRRRSCGATAANSVDHKHRRLRCLYGIHTNDRLGFLRLQVLAAGKEQEDDLPLTNSLS